MQDRENTVRQLGETVQETVLSSLAGDSHDDEPAADESGSPEGAQSGPGERDAGIRKTGPDELPLDNVFEVLKNSRRRRTIRYLKENGGEASLGDLSEHIAAIENDLPEEAITSSQRKRVYVGLYQCHLPKMDDMDIVNFEKNRGNVELGANASQLDPYVETADGPRWWVLYAGLTAIGIVLFAASTLVPAGPGSTTVLAVLLGGLALCSGLHAYSEASGRSDT